MNNAARKMPFLAFLALAIGLWATMEYDPSPNTPASSTMPLLNLKPIDSDDIVQWKPTPGKVTVINFFASWCMPCLAEHPQIKKLAAVNGVEVIGIAWNDKDNALNAWLAKHGNPFTRVFRDKWGRAAIAAGIRGVPETFVLDKQGTVKLHMKGSMDAASADKLTTLLAQWRDEELPHAPAQ